MTKERGSARKKTKKGICKEKEDEKRDLQGKEDEEKNVDLGPKNGEKFSERMYTRDSSREEISTGEHGEGDVQKPF